MNRSWLRSGSVLLGGLLLVAVVAVATVGLGAGDQNNPSSRSAGRLGTLALYTWLQDLGLQVHRVTGSFNLGGTDLLIVYEPTVQFTDAEAQQVGQYVRAGGDAVVVTDAAAVNQVSALYDQLGVEVSRPTDGGSAEPAQLFDASGRVHAVPVGPGYAFAPLVTLVPLLESGGDAVAAVTRLGGGGRAYVLGSSLPFSNDGLRRDDSAYFVLSLLQRARGGRIGFDEFHHGEGDSSTQGAAAIFNGPIGLAAVLLAALVLLSLGLNGRRLGAPVPAGTPDAVPSAAGYVAALGGLFSRTGQRGAVARRYAEELKRAVGARSGVDPRLDDASFLNTIRLADPGPRAESLAALLHDVRSLEGASPDERRLLRAAREVDSFEQAWAQGSELPR